ncbi:MAG TPA: Spy/CpxP family protein refolding chaperone [Candidatus Acidoferrales bacterium]|jgi:Spy/CpxP family protein refolding chaperone|nr:Spy/CpxP family protein refolding chaperone [Candidatus Acidoferrales bacterium]
MAEILLAFALAAILAPGLPTQTSGPHKHSPANAAAEEGHHACLEQERAAFERGEGFGAALVADRNGYPGPRHVLELRSELKLTPEQESALEKLFTQMHEQAVARGKEVLVAEEKLEAMFAQDRAEAELREQAYRVATLRAELRWVHLAAHLAARKLLTSEQLAAYQQLRHGSGASQQTSH